jgi:ABC-type transport system involved in multi-copper enzyme maturation permease subunit
MEQPQVKLSIMDKFFTLGSKVTKNDPIQKAKFDYYLYWVIFLAFCFLVMTYFYSFYKTHSMTSLLWGIVILVVCWFNYWGLISFRAVKKNMDKFHNKEELSESKKNEVIESVDEMLEEFKK